MIPGYGDPSCGGSKSCRLDAYSNILFCGGTNSTYRTVYRDLNEPTQRTQSKMHRES